MSTELEHNDLLEAVKALDGKSKIFIEIEKNHTKNLRLLKFQKDALNNALLSFMQANNEVADEDIVKVVLDRIVETNVAYEQLVLDVYAAYIPADVLDYINSVNNIALQINLDIAYIEIVQKNSAGHHKHH